MFYRTSGPGELYTYLPLTTRNEEVLKKIPPKYVGNPEFGLSVGRGAYNWQKAVGNWISVAFRIKLNDAGKTNGTCPLFTSCLDWNSFLYPRWSWTLDWWRISDLWKWSAPESIRQVYHKGDAFRNFFRRSVIQSLYSLFSLISELGHDPDWASPKDQKAWFADITGVILQWEMVEVNCVVDNCRRTWK